MGTQMQTTTTQTDLRLAFVANDSSSRLLICSSNDAIHWAAETKVGSESSNASPAVTTFNGKTWLAFRSNDSGHQLLICSSDDGVNWTGNTPIGQKSKTGPALCVFNGKLWVAFVADNSSSDILVCSSDDGVHWSNNTKVNQTTPYAPSLCVYKDKLYLAFASSHDQSTNNTAGVNTSVRDVLICSSSDGTTWSGNTKVNETSKDGPSLCAFKDKLWLAFVASGGNNSLLITSSTDGTSWSGNKKMNQSSTKTPMLSTIGDAMYVAFLSDNGKNDVLVCSSTDGTTWSNNVKTNQKSWSWPALFAQKLTTGTLRPRYQVLTVVYAPPGSSGSYKSQVKYASGSTAGTTVSISDAVKTGYEITAKVGDDKAFSGSGAYGSSTTTTNTSTLDVKKSTTTTLTLAGSNKDGINHDSDLVYICLNPLYTITADNWNNVTWAIGVDGTSMIVQYLTVEQLKNPSSIDSTLKAKLDSYGLTDADYAEILKANPMASATDTTTIDTTRYLPTTQSFPYNKPASDGTQPLTTLDINNTTTTTSTHQVQVQNTVTATFTQGMPNVLHFKEVGQLQWTYTNTYGTSTTTTQTASVTIAGPGKDSQVPYSDVLVYWDTVFNTFMFDFAKDQPAYSGTVPSTQGMAVSNQTVTLTSGGKTYTTVTDANGNYRFHHVPKGQATVKVKGQTQAVTVG